MSGGGQSGGTSTQVTTQELAPQQRELLDLVIPRARDFVTNPPELFPGSTIAGFNPLQESAQQAALQAANGPLQGFANNAFQAQQFLQGPVLFPESNPALQSATEAAVRPLTQAFTQSILPNIRGGAEASGQFGGSRQGIAEGIASQSLLHQVGDTSATLQNQAYQAGLDAFSKALLAAPQTAQLGLLPAQVAGAVGDQRQALEQAYLTEAAQRYAAEQIRPFAAAQDVAALAFGIPGGQTTSTGTVPSARGPGAFQSALGGASLGASVGSIGGPMGTGIGAGLGALAGLLGLF